PFYPTEGFRNRLSVERAGGWLGGTTEFTKFEADVSTYIKIGQRDRQALALRAMLGTGSGAGGGLPRPERFRLGGSETLRGYNFGEFEGDRMLVLNAEFRFPIVDAVEGVVFADFGRTFSAGEGISFSDLKAGYGVGIRLDTPLGIVRIDYGIGESGGRTYFSFRPMFSAPAAASPAHRRKDGAGMNSATVGAEGRRAFRPGRRAAAAAMVLAALALAAGVMFVS